MANLYHAQRYELWRSGAKLLGAMHGSSNIRTRWR